jgi:hypothetical protein
MNSLNIGPGCRGGLSLRSRSHLKSGAALQIAQVRLWAVEQSAAFLQASAVKLAWTLTGTNRTKEKPAEGVAGFSVSSGTDRRVGVGIGRSPVLKTNEIRPTEFHLAWPEMLRSGKLIFWPWEHLWLRNTGIWRPPAI